MLWSVSPLILPLVFCSMVAGFVWVDSDIAAAQVAFILAWIAYAVLAPGLRFKQKRNMRLGTAIVLLLYVAI